MSRQEATVDDRLAAIDAAFEEQPRAQLPAEVQQIVMDERPRGAISVAVRRDEREIFNKLKVIATAAGDDFFYSWNTKNKDGTKGVVEGPSVKCANAVARIFGNCSVKVRVFDMGAHWILYAQFYDMETGFVLERPYQQRKNQNLGGGMDKDRAADIVFQIGTSKAARNVVCNALSEFTDFAFAVAKEQLVEKIGKNLPKFHAQVLDRLTTLKVDPHRVELVRGKPFDKWVAADLAKIIAEIQSVNDGMIHPDDVWPPLAEGGGTQAGAPKPQPEDFRPQGETGAAKPTETAKPAAAQPAQAGTGASTPAGEAKTEPAPAAAPAALGADGPQGDKTAPKSDPVAEAAPAQADAGVTDQVPADDEGAREPEVPESQTKAEVALGGAEAVLQRGIDNLGALRTVEQVDEQAPTITSIISEYEDLDPEDKALLLNRWKSAQLERKRDIGRKAKPAGRR